MINTEDILVQNLSQEGGDKLLQFLCTLAIKEDSIPSQIRDVFKMEGSSRKEWLEACSLELQSLKDRNVFTLTELPPGKRPIEN